ncbi:hypothetical protein BpHYR1_007267 [Brachionus plicatilis]|uniref:Uncharacterized protein n=1 Tax=Brachionus plicatilis TaxID=10195 RepID=A0A3M7PPT5_BRAPC|nr:hypothetical protein BpHYR1_007267 [Brachionus plicatilis]
MFMYICPDQKVCKRKLEKQIRERGEVLNNEEKRILQENHILLPLYCLFHLKMRLICCFLAVAMNDRN